MWWRAHFYVPAALCAIALYSMAPPPTYAQSGPNSETVIFGYDAQGRLSTVTHSDGSIRTYVYENASFPNALTGVIDESTNRYSTWGYDSQGRATSSTEAGGADSTSLVYNSDGTATVTDALGAVRTFTFGRYGDRNLVTGISGSQCPTCSEPKATTYDLSGFVSSRTDYNGNITQYTYDDTRGLELSRTEAYGTPRARTITTQWHPTYRLPTLISIYAGGSATGTPLRTIAFNYDSSGNLLTKTITDPVNGVSRTWTYTYNSYGQVLTEDGPRTDVSDVTTYAYYSCTTGGACGHVQTITDAAGHVTTYNTYNGVGEPVTITDPNGLVTTLTYDGRQRLTSRSAGGETTTFSYYPTGLLEQVTLPDGSDIHYTYDTAHRLTEISDGAGNSIQYARDAMGNWTTASAYDPNSTLARTRSRVYNTLNELYQQVGAAGTAAVTTSYGYDANGNRTSIDAPLSRNTGQRYDELDRLTQITDPALGNTLFGYDAKDDLTSVTDPRGLVTNYTRNGFGDITQLQSPDTGTANMTYDSAGNLATRTDARGDTGTYTYDALNRVTSIAYPDQTISFTYDGGTNGKGRLTGASDANHSLSWTYDALGRITGKSQTVAGVSELLTYGYMDGDLTSMTTPSGQSVSYGYTDGRITSVAVNGTTVLSSVIYEPFGSVKQWTWGNGTQTVRSYDMDGNTTGVDSAGTLTYDYDDAFRITEVTDPNDSSRNWSYGYDPLDRLTSADSTALSQTWTYDANGNRLTEGGTASSTYTIQSSTNHLTSISGALSRSYTYDAAGDVMSDGTRSFSYDDAGRMTSATVGGATTNYVLNALGQRIEKSEASGDEFFVYDKAGHLIGEYDGTGSLIEETVWLTDIPVATLRPNGSGGVDIYYVHTDQLNAPRRVTRPSDGAVVWAWDPDPFGTAAANQDPSGLGTFVYNLRFPGQYFDEETGLSYNYMRDYDPTVGRYVESDPIGLLGGRNTYTYVGANPLNGADPLGLIKWNGTLFSLGVVASFGAIYDEATLYSECVNGERLKITVKAAGPAAGAGVRFSATVSDISFEDYQTTLDPNGFNGAFTTGTAGLTWGALPTSGRGPGPVSPIGPGLPGIGVGVGYVQFGQNFSNPLPPGLVFGRDKSVMGAVGTATVTSVTKSVCNCSSK